MRTLICPSESLRCATCGDEMPTLEALKEHRRIAHPPSPTGDPARAGMKKGFQCDYCGKNFSCRSNLRDHLVMSDDVEGMNGRGSDPSLKGFRRVLLSKKDVKPDKYFDLLIM